MRAHKPIKEEDFEDELEDQFAQTLMNEANEMGIFQEGPAGDGVDYTKALEKIQQSIKKNEEKQSDYFNLSLLMNRIMKHRSSQNFILMRSITKKILK